MSEGNQRKDPRLSGRGGGQSYVMAPFTPDTLQPARTLATAKPVDPSRSSAPNSPLMFEDPGDEQGRPNAWVEEAVCSTIDPELFFPDRSNHQGYREARKICQSCPVAQQCLEDAMRFEAGASSHRFGMYGGTTPAERDIIELASAA